MKKVFLYLYPIKEYTDTLMFNDDNLYDEWKIKRPLPILNECIQKRYREKGYQVVFVLYPDKDIFGIDIKNEDKIIYTDVYFSEACAIDENKKGKCDFIPKYPNEKLLLNQLGNIDELIIGGYHAKDCVKRVAIASANMGIPTLVDLDLTDLFFSLYRQENYFKIDEYNPQRYKCYVYSQAERYGENFIDRLFSETYSDPVYGFNADEVIKKL